VAVLRVKLRLLKEGAAKSSTRTTAHPLMRKAVLVCSKLTKLDAKCYPVLRKQAFRWL